MMLNQEYVNFMSKRKIFAKLKLRKKFKGEVLWCGNCKKLEGMGYIQLPFQRWCRKHLGHFKKSRYIVYGIIWRPGVHSFNNKKCYYDNKDEPVLRQGSRICEFYE